jgi:hypothetical protein
MHLYLDTIVLLESISHLPWYLSLTKCQSSSCQHMYSPITLVIHISFLPHPRSLPMYYYHKQFSDYIHFMGMPLPTSGSPIILPQLTVWFLLCVCVHLEVDGNEVLILNLVVVVPHFLFWISANSPWFLDFLPVLLRSTIWVHLYSVIE